ncbi:MAG: hypothetical protein KBT21_01800 [Treponema sp.]|nr:hypothetical protein [Candidatus Treponema merdequi]
MKKNFILFQIFIIALFFSIISCSNPLSFNTQSRKTDFPSAATGTVSGKLTFKGAIPQELIGRNTNSTSSKTAVPVFNMTGCVYVITAYDPMDDNPYPNITATFNDNHTEYTLKGIALGSPCTVEVNVYRDASQAYKILTGKNTFTLTQESPIVSADIILEPIQTTSIPNSITRSVNLLIKVPAVSVGYVEAVNSQNLCSYICTHSSDPEIYTLSLNPGLQLSQSGPKSVTVNFYSGNDNENKGNLLYSFTETINIFDNLETNTWIKNADGTNSDPHLVLQDSQTMIADCIITQHLINNFTLTTFYVDTTAGSSTEAGTSDNPFKSLQAAVDHIIENGNTKDKYTIYIKNDIDLESRILFIQTGQEIRNITIAGYDGVKTIKRTSDCSLTLFELCKESYNITLRDLILDGNNKNTAANGGAIRNSSNLTLENVTIQKFICTNTNSAGGAIYNGGTLTLKKSKILDCKSASDKAYGGAIYNGNSKTLILDDVVISGCKTQADTASQESYGGGIYNAGTCKINKAIITGCSAIANSGTPGYAKGGAIYNKDTLILGDSVCNSDGSPDVTIGIGSYNGEEYTTPNEAFAGAGVYSGENGSTAFFTMNRDCVIGKFNPPRAPINESYGNRSIANSMSGSGGAGVWIYKTNLTINGGFISYNYAENESHDAESFSIIGVGLYYKGTDQAEISNLVISYNKAFLRGTVPYAIAGVGLYAEKSVTLNNVKIENNTYQTTTNTTPIKGKGLYAKDDVTVTLKGTTYFGIDDDIYLDVHESQEYNGTLKVNSILNPQNTFGVQQQYVATITPGAYVTENAFLTGSRVGTEYKKFKVKTDSSGDNWGIGSNGKNIKIIGTKAPGNYAVGDIVFNDGSATSYSEGPILTEEQKNAAIAVIFRVGDGSEGNKTLGVGIKYSDIEKMWCISNSKGYTTMFNTDCPQDEGTSSGSLTFKNSPHTDGSKNLKIMIQDLGEQNDTGVTCNEDGTINFSASPNQTTLNNNYPAFEFAYYYGKTNGHNITSGSAFENGWYLPSISELNDIYQANKNQVIQDAFEVTGNSMITDLTWSSSQGTHNTLGITNNARVFHFSDGSVSGELKHYYYYYVYAVRAFD